jgi:hypothetical protein
MTVISDVFILDVSDNEDLEYRDKKYCVCVSVLGNKCLLINSKNSGIYDELEIDSSDYEPNGKPRFVACKNLFEFKECEIIKRLGSFNYSNMVKILDKLKAKNRKQFVDVIIELDKWLKNYERNKLADVFKKR